FNEFAGDLLINYASARPAFCPPFLCKASILPGISLRILHLPAISMQGLHLARHLSARPAFSGHLFAGNIFKRYVFANSSVSYSKFNIFHRNLMHNFYSKKKNVWEKMTD